MRDYYMTPKNKGGRPLKFESAEVLQQKIDEYFDWCDSRVTKVPTKAGVIEVPDPRPYTMSGLAYYLGTNRETIRNYSNREEFFDTISRAREKVEQFVEESLWKPKITSGVTFNLKNNFGWRDEKNIDHTSGGDKIGGINYVTPDGTDNPQTNDQATSGVAEASG